MITFSPKEIALFCTSLLSASAVYWTLVIRVIRVESNVDALKSLVGKVDELIKAQNESNKMLAEHIAFHRGQESQTNG